MSEDEPQMHDTERGLLRHVMEGWFGLGLASSIPLVPITDEPTPADIKRAHELTREYGLEYLLTNRDSLSNEPGSEGKAND
jgi:hypothetical protein